MNREKIKLPARLSKPINPISDADFIRDGLRIDFDNEHNKKIVEKHTYEKLYRLLLLFEHYKIKLGDWPLLALRIAEDYHPALREAKPAGRKAKWDALNQAMLKVEIDNIRSQKNKNFSVKAAARIIIKEDFWKNLAGKSDPDKSVEILRHYYYRADSEWVKWITKDPIGQGVYQELVKK